MPMPSLDPDDIQKRFSKNPMVLALIKEGGELVRQSEKPNVITVEQFLPFVPLFKMDKERYLSEEPEKGPYYLAITELDKRFLRDLSINKYQPILVIRSREDDRIVAWFDRRFTRIKSDAFAGPSAKDKVPRNVPRATGTTRGELLFEASIVDLAHANQTPEVLAYFRRIREESAFINQRFMEQNMTPSKRQEITGDTSKSDPVVFKQESPSSYMIIDDD
jgi:hypothetical protein